MVNIYNPGQTMNPPQKNLRWLTLLAAFWMLPSHPASAGLDPTKDKILYLVADAHLDNQWNWTIQDTINSYIPKTLSVNFAYFNKYPDYVFNFEGALRYHLIKEYYPADYLTLSNYIAQGRWRVAGSCVVAGDVNLPSPEALFRQILYGNGFWKKEFGKTSQDIFLPDCFGFGYALPAVAANCGLKGFSSQKLSWGSSLPIPFENVGRWIGPDGSSLISVLQPGPYNSTITDNLANDTGELDRMTNNFAQTGLFLDYRYYGTGDTGGGPDDASVNWMEQSLATTNGGVHVLSAGADQLYRALTPAQTAMLPTYQGELLMKTHGSGCYTSHPEMKKYNRQNELRADAAERVSVMADWLQGGDTYPQDELTSAWERFLWHQFHDDLTGTSIPAAYTFSWNDELLSLNEFGAMESHGAGILTKAMNTTATGVPLVVYNALSIARQDVVSAVVNFTNGAPADVRVFDAAGNEVPSQLGAAVGNQVPVTFLAAVPANGAAVFDVRPSSAPCTLNTGLSISTSQIENDRYRVQVNAAGDVASIYDKINHRELLNAPIRWGFFDDVSTTWPAWEVQYSTVAAAPLSYLGGAPVISILENGPARASLGITRVHNGSVFTERLGLAAGAAGDRLEWDVSLNWSTPETLLKVIFPLAVTNQNATYDLGLGAIQRSVDTADLYEVPAQQWADLTDAQNNYGVSILDDCKYGWDKPDDHTLRLTVEHTPAVGGSYVYAATNGFGSQRLTFALMGHTNDWRSGQSPFTAARLNQPLQAFQTTSHAGILGGTFSFLTCDNSNVMVKAIKKAENSNEIMVRLQELTGQTQTVQLTGVTAITSARQVNGAEDPVASLTPVNGKLTVSLTPYQPLTLALTLAAPSALVARPVSETVALPYNLDAISSDANRTDGNFDGGYTYPAELIPSTIVRDGIAFQMGPAADGANNAVACAGQTLTLPSGYDQVYLLAAAASNDVTAPFTIDGLATHLTVRYFTGFIGQWNPPYLKNDEVGWVCTHRHTADGQNDAYRFCYLFKYRLDLPPGATGLTLPDCPNLRIFAVSVAKNTTASTTPAGGLLKENQLPWANAGSNRKVNAGSNGVANVELDGSGSVDPDGSIVAYAWSQNGSVITNGERAEVSLPVGTNTVALAVTDNQGGVGRAVVTIIVATPLNVGLTASPTNSSSAPLTVQFTGKASGGLLAPYDSTDDQTGSVTAQGENSPDETAANAFDNSNSTKWLDFANAYPATRSSWIQYQYAGGRQTVVTTYTLTSANDSPERDPADWKLLGSNDGGSTWTTLDARANQVFTARFQKQTFAITNPSAYNIYRLEIDRVYNPSAANSVQLSEIELISVPQYVYSWNFGDGSYATGQNPQHTYTSNGSYAVTLGVTCGDRTGTNTALISIGTPLTANFSALPGSGIAPLSVQFTAQAGGGDASRAPYSTTSDHLGVVSAQGENAPNEMAANAFDGTTATKWLDFANADSSTRSSWIQYQYPNDMRCLVSQYTVASANDATVYSDRNPADWRLLGSNDGGSTWTTLDVQKSQSFTQNYQTLTYNISNLNSYNLYRFQIDKVADPTSANSVQLSELQFMGHPTCTFHWSFGDGASSIAQNPQHTYAQPGTYQVVLSASDGIATVSPTFTVKVMPPPVLNMTELLNRKFSLSWPAYATNYQLYMATNLAAPTVWMAVTNAPTLQGGSNTVSLPIEAGQQFYQLRRP